VPAGDRLLIRRCRSCGGCGRCWLVEYPRVLHGVLLADGSDGRTVSPWHPQRRANMKKATDLQGSVASRAAEGRYIRPESEPGGRAPALLSAAGAPAVRGRVSSTSAQMLIPIPGRLILNSFFMLRSPPQCSANRVSPAGRSSYRTGTNNTLRARPDRAKSFFEEFFRFFPRPHFPASWRGFPRPVRRRESGCRRPPAWSGRCRAAAPAAAAGWAVLPRWPPGSNRAGW